MLYPQAPMRQQVQHHTIASSSVLHASDCKGTMHGVKGARQVMMLT